MFSFVEVSPRPHSSFVLCPIYLFFGPITRMHLPAHTDECILGLLLVSVLRGVGPPHESAAIFFFFFFLNWLHE